MDVEKLKKMNQLAALLRQNKLVEDRMEAAAMAGALAGEGQEIRDMFMITPDQKMVIKDDYVRTHDHTEAQQPTKPGVTEERMLQVLQSFADQFVAAVNKLEAQMVVHEQLLREFKDFKDHAGQLQTTPVQHTTEGFTSQQPSAGVHTVAAQPATSVAPSPLEVPSSTQMAKLQNEATKDHPRSGSYKPADVAIDKIFYFGTNK